MHGLHADRLLDRTRLKQQLRNWKMLAIISFALLLIAVSLRATGVDFSTGGYIARYTAEGLIMNDKHRDKLFDRLKKDDDVKAVLFHIDSPGGTVYGGEQLYLSLRDIAEVKPVVAVMRSLGTSGAYMAALGADHIVARHGSVTGSIGVLMQTFQATELASDIGVKPIILKSSKFKATPNPFEAMDPEQRAAAMSVVDDFYQFFASMVKERRGYTDEELLTVADGRIFTGSQALELGLVDAIGGEAEALAWLQEHHGITDGMRIKEVRESYKNKPAFMRNMATLIGLPSLPDPSILLHSGILAVWYPGLVQMSLIH